MLERNMHEDCKSCKFKEEAMKPARDSRWQNVEIFHRWFKVFISSGNEKP